MTWSSWALTDGKLLHADAATAEQSPQDDIENDMVRQSQFSVHQSSQPNCWHIHNNISRMLDLSSKGCRFHFWPSCYQVVTTEMGHCQRTDKPSSYIVPPWWTQPYIPPGNRGTYSLACLCQVKAFVFGRIPSRCVVELAMTTVKILSLKIRWRKKQEKVKKFSCFFAMLLYRQNCSVCLKMQQAYFWAALSQTSKITLLLIPKSTGQ